MIDISQHPKLIAECVEYLESKQFTANGRGDGINVVIDYAGPNSLSVWASSPGGIRVQIYGDSDSMIQICEAQNMQQVKAAVELAESFLATCQQIEGMA